MTPGDEASVKGLSTAALLAGAGAFLDGFTYVGHGHVFANAMTGNVVLLGINCIAGSWTQAFRHVPPICAFLLGVSAARALNLPALRRRIKDPYLAVLLTEIAILLTLSLLPATANDFLITTSIAFAASMQVATFREVNGRTYNSTFTTGNLRTLSEAAFDWWFAGGSPESARAARDFAIICTAFLIGAALGGYFTLQFGNRALWLDIALLLIISFRIR